MASIWLVRPRSEPGKSTTTEQRLGPLAATRNPATFMNAEDKYGSVTSGKIDDLVLLDADPLRDILNTTKISAVFLGGKEFNRVKLDQILQNAQDSAATRPR